MRAIECIEPRCVHLHANSDPELRQVLLRHYDEAHPSMALRAHTAASLVEEAGYLDVKHGKKEDRLEFRDTPGITMGGAG